MDYSSQAIVCNGCAAVLLFTLLLNYRPKHNMMSRESALFVRMISANLLQCIIEPITVLINGRLFPGAMALNIGCNAFLYVNNTMFALLWVLYAREKTHQRRPSPWESLVYLPALTIALCAAANLFTPIFFAVSAQNVYQRQWPFLATYAAIYFYLILGSVTILRHRKRREQSVFLPTFTFLFPVLLATMVQFFIPGISLIGSGSAIGLAATYMSILDESVFTDKLSGLFSRHYLNQYLNTLPERTKDAALTLGIMLDVDNFKDINDSFGHLTGDDAIAAVGKILRAAIPDNRLIFRYAGDEFVVIMSIQELSQVEPILARIAQETAHFNQIAGKPYHLHLSAGFTTYVPGENPNAFLARMDARMYENKRDHKGNFPT